MHVCVNTIPVKTLIDSGAQVPIICRDILSDIELKMVGSIYVQGIFGDPIEAQITPVKVRRCNDDAEMAGITSFGDETQILCAVVDE